MNRDKTIIKMGILGIITNILLSTFKAIVGLFSGSIAIILDAVNNLTDTLSSIITIIGTKLAAKKPDKEHPFGHGRIEYFATIVVAILIFFAGIIAFKESIEKIISPSTTNYTITTIVIISIAIIVKYIYGKYIKSVGNKINSNTLIATGIDSLYDAVLSLTTLIAAIVSILFNISIEGYIGLIISIFIIKTSIELLKGPVDDIIGKRFDIELTNKIKDKINSFENVFGTYDLHLNSYGPNKIVGSCHIEVDSKMEASDIHKLTSEISYRIYEEFGIVLTIGIYAINKKDKESNKIYNELKKIIEKEKNILELHGFYIDKKKKNIYFDLVISFDEKQPDELKDKIEKQIRKKFSKYNYIIVIDADISN